MLMMPKSLLAHARRGAAMAYGALRDCITAPSDNPKMIFHRRLQSNLQTHRSPLLNESTDGPMVGVKIQDF
jgi:hypothetical protein